MSKSKPCRVENCDLPKERPSHSCAWHRLMREPIEVQVAAARAREAATPDDARLPRLDRSAWTPGTRFCASCQSLPPLFYFAAGATQCRACSSASRHAASIRKEYDLEPAEYDALLTLQDGRCAICRQRPVSIRLAVDHDHQTGAVLGLLCSRCNREGKGALHDSLDLARNLVHYMEHPPMSGEWTVPRMSPKPAAKARVDRAELDPSYLMFDHEAADRPLPTILQEVAKRLTLDQLVLSGGRSDPETGVYWLAYRRSVDEDPPWETAKATRMD